MAAGLPRVDSNIIVSCSRNGKEAAESAEALEKEYGVSNFFAQM